jgi:hypothetical protein
MSSDGTYFTFSYFVLGLTCQPEDRNYLEIKNPDLLYKPCSSRLNELLLRGYEYSELQKHVKERIKHWLTALPDSLCF